MMMIMIISEEKNTVLNTKGRRHPRPKEKTNMRVGVTKADICYPLKKHDLPPTIITLG